MKWTQIVDAEIAVTDVANTLTNDDTNFEGHVFMKRERERERLC